MIRVVAWLADWALEKRVSASLRLVLYAAVLIRIALPADWRNPLGLLGPPSATTGVILEESARSWAGPGTPDPGLRGWPAGRCWPMRRLRWLCWRASSG